MLKVQRRYNAPCTRPEWDQCLCAGKGADSPIIITGTLNRRRIRLSATAFLPPERARDLSAARDLAILWEKSGRPMRLEEYTSIAVAATVEPPTVEMTVEAFLSDSRDRAAAASRITTCADLADDDNVARSGYFSGSVAAIVFLAAAALAPPAMTATITDLGPGGASAINASGQVVGSGPGGGFLYSGGVVSNFGTTVYPNSINDSGQVVGASSLASGFQQAFLYSGGVLTNLGTLGGNYSDAYGINDAGQIVGVSSGVVCCNDQAFSYSDGS